MALKTTGNWYWVVDEIEAAGFKPKLVNATKARLLMGCEKKTDKLDVKGMNKLQRCGTLQDVWIPPSGLRDLRELPRTRMTFVRYRTRLKNRIHSTLSKYGILIDEVSDIFGQRGRMLIEASLKQLPPIFEMGVHRGWEHSCHVRKETRQPLCEPSLSQGQVQAKPPESHRGSGSPPG